jgi:hypothetical protein
MKEKLSKLYLGIYCIPCILIILMIIGINISSSVGAAAIVWFLLQSFFYPIFNLILSFIKE